MMTTLSRLDPMMCNRPEMKLLRSPPNKPQLDAFFSKSQKYAEMRCKKS